MCLRLAACLLLLQTVSVATGAPVEAESASHTTTETLDCNNDNSDVYDQRQNGTENYRIHVNGIVVLVAPPETVLQAAQLSTLGTEGEGSNATTQILKPKPKPQTATDKDPSEKQPQETSVIHPKEKNNLKLLNLLHMFRSIKNDADDSAQHPSQ